MLDFRRGEIWQVDFEPQIGSEISKRRPAVILSANAFNEIARLIGILIVVPGTTKRMENPKTGQLAAGYCEVKPTQLNGLDQTTYFIAHQVKAISLFRVKDRIGTLENSKRKYIASLLAEVLGLYDDLGV